MKRYKAIVIGSGAGGAPAALTLAEKWGDGVAIVEAGKHHTARDFNQLERDMVPKLYAQSGVQGTEDGTMSVLQGRTVGGSTVVNDALCFKPPEEIDDRWAAHGAEIRVADLAPHVAKAEALMGVTDLERNQINRANYLVGLGAARMGWDGERLRHNSVGCVQCGFRHLGCAYDAKRSMNKSFVPAAIEAGAVLHAEHEVIALHRTEGQWRVQTVRGDLYADIVVLAAGIVQTPAILLRSGFEAGSGLQFHLQTIAWGDHAEPVDGHNGIPMSYGVMEFADVYGRTGPGYLIEGVGVQPLAFSVQPQFEGLDHDEVLSRYRYLNGAVSLVRSSSRGRVSLLKGRPSIDYTVNDHDQDRIRHFFDRATELHLAAGAERVLLAHRHVRWVSKPTPLPSVAPGHLYLYTAHPFGGANRGTVTDGIGRMKGAENLWVLDASAFPEALGVNPQITIAAVAMQGAARIAS